MTYAMLQDEAIIVAAAILLIFVELPGGHATVALVARGHPLALLRMWDGVQCNMTDLRPK